ncbi:Ppx/GppA phosphatase family protein [Virgibacillus sediminis]|uniref:Exopolyphosphatase n=1 Tax=Virgibacillus sediminis TaxID=202260 RepID=A0ABV7AAE5_9BACI
MQNYYSIIDIGSNTMRLVIYARENSGRLHEVENIKIVARLSEHLDKDNMLTEEGQNILINNLKSFEEVTESYHLIETVCIATAAIRQAENQEKIKHDIKEQIGWNLRILPGDQEAFYGYLAVVNSTSIKEGITVDIGGGSTEVTYFKDRKLVESHSFPFGALTLKEYYSKNNSSEKGRMELRRYVAGQLQALPWIKDKEVPLIGIGGSARNMAQIDQNIKRYPLAGLHQYKMNDSDISRISSYLSSLSLAKRQKVEGLSKDRADSILPAVDVFHCIYEEIQATCFVLSRKGLRDGVLYEQLFQKLEQPVLPDVLKNSMSELVNDFNRSSQQIIHVHHLLQKIFKAFQLKGIGSLTKQDWSMLELAEHVYYLGKYIDSESSAQHTFYLLANRSIDGLMHRDRIRLALIGSFKSKTVFKQFLEPYKDWFLKEERKKLRLLGALLKFSFSLDATKRQVVQDIDLEFKKDGLLLTLYCNKDYIPEEYQAEKQKKHLEKALNTRILLSFTSLS